jgi:hypothetical protein
MTDFKKSHVEEKGLTDNQQGTLPKLFGNLLAASLESPFLLP